MSDRHNAEMDQLLYSSLPEPQEQVQVEQVLQVQEQEQPGKKLNYKQRRSHCPIHVRSKWSRLPTFSANAVSESTRYSQMGIGYLIITNY
jgi:hypothetical protein